MSACRRLLLRDVNISCAAACHDLVNDHRSASMMLFLSFSKRNRSSACPFWTLLRSRLDFCWSADKRWVAEMNGRDFTRIYDVTTGISPNFGEGAWIASFKGKKFAGWLKRNHGPEFSSQGSCQIWKSRSTPWSGWLLWRVPCTAFPGSPQVRQNRWQSLWMCQTIDLDLDLLWEQVPQDEKSIIYSEPSFFQIWIPDQQESLSKLNLCLSLLRVKSE